jgi:hypothetical protein
METMAIVINLMSGVLHGALVGFLAGIAIIIFLHKRVQPLIVSILTTLIAILGVLFIRAAWELSGDRYYMSLSTSLRESYWGWFFIALLVVIGVLQWLAWLIERVTQVYWSKEQSS